MIPLNKVREIILKHKNLEQELSTGEVKKDSFAQKSKEYSELNEIIVSAREIEKFQEKSRLTKRFPRQTEP